MPQATEYQEKPQGEKALLKIRPAHNRSVTAHDQVRRCPHLPASSGPIEPEAAAVDSVRSDARKQPTRTGGEAAAQPNERAAAPIGVRPAT